MITLRVKEKDTVYNKAIPDGTLVTGSSCVHVNQ